MGEECGGWGGGGGLGGGGGRSLSQSLSVGACPSHQSMRTDFLEEM